MSAFGFLLFPVEESIQVVNLFPTQVNSAIARFDGQLTPLKFRGRKRKYERHQLNIYQGDTETFVIQISLQDLPFDLTDYIIEASIKFKPDAEMFIDTQTIADEQNGTVLSEGHIVWVIPKEVTNVLPIKSLFDISAKKGDTKTTICSGLFMRVDSITD